MMAGEASIQKAELSLEEQIAAQLCSYHLEPTEALASDKTMRFLMGKAGAYRLEDNNIGLFISKAKTVPGLPDYAEGMVNFKLPKIPYNLFLITVSFFRRVMRERGNAEAMVQFYWDAENNTWIMDCPEQRVSGASVHFVRNNELADKYLLVMDIHSHNTMGAFWSGTDNADEQATRLYGVFGLLNREDFQYKFRVAVAGVHHDITRDIVFEVPENPTIEERAFPEVWLERCQKPPAVVYDFRARTLPAGRPAPGYAGQGGKHVPVYEYEDYDYSGHRWGQYRWWENEGWKPKGEEDTPPTGTKIEIGGTRAGAATEFDRSDIEAMLFAMSPEETQILMETVVTYFVDDLADALNSTWGVFEDLVSAVQKRGVEK